MEGDLASTSPLCAAVNRFVAASAPIIVPALKGVWIDHSARTRLGLRAPCARRRTSMGKISNTLPNTSPGSTAAQCHNKTKSRAGTGVRVRGMRRAARNNYSLPAGKSVCRCCCVAGGDSGRAVQRPRFLANKIIFLKATTSKRGFICPTATLVMSDCQVAQRQR